MPTYEYKCVECLKHKTAVHRVNEALVLCEWCGGKLEKVIFAAQLIFKGAGWTPKGNK